MQRFISLRERSWVSWSPSNGTIIHLPLTQLRALSPWLVHEMTVQFLLLSKTCMCSPLMPSFLLHAQRENTYLYPIHRFILQRYKSVYGKNKMLIYVYIPLLVKMKVNLKWSIFYHSQHSYVLMTTSRFIHLLILPTHVYWWPIISKTYTSSCGRDSMFLFFWFSSC